LTAFGSLFSKYRIPPEDIFNFDEIGYAIGLTTTAKVVTRAEYCNNRCQVVQPKGRE
jgi:hypothetical protein